MKFITYFSFIFLLSSFIGCANSLQEDGKPNREAGLAEKLQTLEPALHPIAYGDMDYTPIAKMPYEARRISHGVGLMTTREYLQKSKSDGFYAPRMELLENSNNLCPDEPLAKEKGALNVCTTFLLTPQIALTTAHCFENSRGEFDPLTVQKSCDDQRIIFNFRKDLKGKLKLQWPSSEIYRCKKVLKIEHLKEGLDYAVFLLDRPAPVKPLTVATSTPRPGETVTLLGYPKGLPLRASRGLVVGKTNGLITTTLDAFSGDSGALVLNANNQAVGIFSKGNSDWIPDEDMGCSRLKKCAKYDPLSEDCNGEKFVPLPSILKDFLNLVK